MKKSGWKTILQVIVSSSRRRRRDLLEVRGKKGRPSGRPFFDVLF